MNLKFQCSVACALLFAWSLLACGADALPRIDCDGYSCELGLMCGPEGSCVPVPPPIESGVDGPSGPDWALIKAGSFVMGSPEDEEGRSPHETQHAVTLTRSFEIMRTPVTQAQWQALMLNKPLPFATCGDNCPVEGANWWDAVSYANALSESEGIRQCYRLQSCTGRAGEDLVCHWLLATGSDRNPYDCEGYRLPTEAEWEYAARAGTTGARYGELDAIAWYFGNSRYNTHPVGQKQPNAWGLYDMLGNVWEWTGDWNREYESSAVTDPWTSSTASTSTRVLRGGSQGNSAASVRAASRHVSVHEKRSHGYGFRLVRTVPWE